MLTRAAPVDATTATPLETLRNRFILSVFRIVDGMRIQDVTNAKLSRIIGTVELLAERRVTMVTDNGVPMTKHLIAALLLAAAGPAAATAQSTRPAATKNGFAVDRLARIDNFLQQYVDSNQIAGAVALVVRDGQVVYEK